MVVWLDSRRQSKTSKSRCLRVRYKVRASVFLPLQAALLEPWILGGGAHMTPDTSLFEASQSSVADFLQVDFSGR